MKNYFEELDDIKREYSRKNHLKKYERIVSSLIYKELVIYGAGYFGHVLFSILNSDGFKIAAFCDSFKKGVDIITGLDIITPQLLSEDYKDALVMIGVYDNDLLYEEIKTGLIKYGMADNIVSRDDALFLYRRRTVLSWFNDTESMLSHFEKYDKTWDMLEDDESRSVILNRLRALLLWESMPHFHIKDMYFAPDIINLTSSEVFVDGGFFTGDTTEEFINRVNGLYKHVYAFEPDINNLQRHKLINNANITMVNKGLWDCDGTMSFSTSADMESHISASGKDIIPVTTIDNYFRKIMDIPTYIKMDVEGAEKQVWIGAENTIKKYKPKLAVCVYHKLEDICVLGEITKSFNPNYKFFLRHYNWTHLDTVLYAI